MGSAGLRRALSVRGLCARYRAARAHSCVRARANGPAGLRFAGLPGAEPRTRRHQGRSARGGLGGPHRVRVTLTSHINAVRKAIGDSGEEQTPDPYHCAQRISFCRRGQGGARSSASRSARTRTCGSGATKPRTRHRLALPDKPSIAVLPFQNLSGDPEQEYFADGIVEDIITALSRLRWLFVIARNSSFTYKGRAVT